MAIPGVITTRRRRCCLVKSVPLFKYARRGHQMHDRIATAKPLVGEPLELKGLGRDLRLDVCRGIALWFIFLDHVPNNIESWLTMRNYGFCDNTEMLIFASTLTCALSQL